MRPVKAGPKHTAAINALITPALNNTVKIIMDERKKKGWRVPADNHNKSLIAHRHKYFDRIYHGEMNRMAREAGLRDI